MAIENEVCPNCNKKMYFNIGDFLLDNSPLFTIFAFIGTMLALLPNLVDKLYGTSAIDWKDALKDTPVTSLLLVAIVCGSFFLLLLILIITKKLIEGHKEEKDLGIVPFLKIGDLERILFIIFFYPFIVTIFLFLCSLFIELTLFWSYLILITLFLILELLLLLKIGATSPQNLIILSILIIIFVLILIFQNDLIQAIQHNFNNIQTIHSNKDFFNFNISDIFIPNKYNLQKVELPSKWFL